MSYSTGEFRAKAVSGELGYSGKNSEQIAVQFEILEGADAGKVITWWGYFSDKAADRTLQDLLKTGWDGEDISVLRGLGDKEVKIKIADSTYQGVTRQKIIFINSMGEGNGPKVKKTMEEGARADFASRMRGRTLNLQKVDPPASTDDIPF